MQTAVKPMAGIHRWVLKSFLAGLYSYSSWVPFPFCHHHFFHCKSLFLASSSSFSQWSFCQKLGKRSVVRNCLVKSVRAVSPRAPEKILACFSAHKYLGAALSEIISFGPWWIYSLRQSLICFGGIWQAMPKYKAPRYRKPRFCNFVTLV